MKGLLIIGIAVALVVDLALFFGIGFASGALSSVGGITVNHLTDGPGGLEFQVQVSGADANGFYGSDYFPNGSSQPITFDTYVWVGNTSCSQQPAWLAGKGAGSIWYTITVSFNGVAESIPGTQNGYLTISDNGSAQNSAWCYGSGLSNSAGGGFYQHTIWLPGNYSDDSVVTIESETVGAYCSTATSPQAACAVGGGSSGSGSGPWKLYDSPSCRFFGGCESPPYSQVILRSGYSALYQPQGTFFNGGQLPISYSTGYSVGQWKVCFQKPSLQGGANIACNNVGSNTQGTTTFSIPANASSPPPASCAVPCAWNLFQATLYNSLFPGAYVPSISIDISPQFMPGTPTITWVDNTHTGGIIQQGDSITVTATATNPANSSKFGTINGMILGAYYAIGESTPPVSGSYWLGGNPHGTPMAVVANAGGATGTYTFTINMGGSGNGAVITGTVTVVTTVAQTSQNSFSIQVTPGNCGSATCGNIAHGVWQLVGPVLFAGAFILGTALLAAFGKGKPPLIFLPIVTTGVFVVLFIFGWIQPWFNPGGPIG